MSYLDFTDDIIAIDQSNNTPSTTMQPLTRPSNTSASVHDDRQQPQTQQQQARDLSDWRNIQLGASSTFFDPFWLPHTPVTPLSSPWAASNNTVYPSPYNPSLNSSQPLYPSANPNNNQPWKMPAFPIGKTQPFVNFNHSNVINNATDMPTNAIINPSTPIRFDKC